MPWFRKQSEKAKKKLQHQLYLARESRESTFDITGCELIDIPQGTFSLCKVLQKDTLLANNNWLTSLKGGGNFRDLENLQVLNLYDNDLASLPDDIGYLSHLVVLNVEKNKLKELPESLGHLKYLENLNCKENKLKAIPTSLCNLKSLRSLDVSSNMIHKLPQELCYVRTLETLVLDSRHIQYPPADVCAGGTENIIRFLCKECDIQYLPPSEFEGAIPSPAKSPVEKSNDQIDNLLASSPAFMQYEQMKEKKRQERIALERQLEEEQLQQAQLATQSRQNKKHLVEYMARDQERIQDELNVLQQQKDKEREYLVVSLKKAEENASDLVNDLLEMSEKARRTENLLDLMEKERIELEKWFEVKQEEIESLRKKEVLANMERLLQENTAFFHMFDSHMTERSEFARRAQGQAQYYDEKVDSILAHRQADQSVLIAQLVKEEKLQKEAFAALQFQKDARLKRITGQIELIEQELSQLTVLELEQKQLKLDVQMNVLADKRIALSQLLAQLIGEQQHREDELKKRLIEMEKSREDHQTDYWLVQYQRLMDMKPHAMINMEKKLEFAVVEILEKADATDYIPLFSRHRITIETLRQLKDEELKQMGVHEMGLRKSILGEIDKYNLFKQEERAAAKQKNIDWNEDDQWLVKPPAPAVPAPAVATTPSAPQPGVSTAPTEITARINTECVICMENESTALFLNCGHICCCKKCSEPLKECPLCRGVIAQKITLRGYSP